MKEDSLIKGSGKRIVTVLAFLILVLPEAISARERRGANLLVTLKDGHSAAGELIAVKPDSLLLLNFAGADQSVELVGIRSIRIIKESKAGQGAIYGALAGTLISGLSAALSPAISWQTGHLHPSATGVILIAALGGAAGGLLGYGAGALAGSDKTIQFEGKSGAEDRARALAYLRAKARIRDYQ
jgi:hypothetical protein